MKKNSSPCSAVFAAIGFMTLVLFASCVQSPSVGILVFDKHIDVNTPGEWNEKPLITKQTVRSAIDAAVQNAENKNISIIVKNIPRKWCGKKYADRSNSIQCKKIKKAYARLMRKNVRVVADYTCASIITPAPVDDFLPVSITPSLLRTTGKQSDSGVFSSGVPPDAQAHAVTTFLRANNIAAAYGVQDGLRYSDALMNTLEQHLGATNIAFAQTRLLPNSFIVDGAARDTDNYALINAPAAAVFAGVWKGAAQFVNKLQSIATSKYPIVLSNTADSPRFIQMLSNRTTIDISDGGGVYVIRRAAGTAAADVMKQWYKKTIANNRPPRRAAEEFSALQIALAAVGAITEHENGNTSNTTQDNQMHADEILRGRIFSTAIGDIFFDENNTMRGVYTVQPIPPHGSGANM